MPAQKKENEDFRKKRVTFEQAAKFLKLSKSTFYRLIESGVIPKSDDGEYILSEVVEAYWRNQLDPEGLTVARTRLVTAQAELAEAQLAEQRGELHRASAVIKVWADNVTNAKTRLLAIPTKIAPELVGKDLQTITLKIKNEINDALKELADYDARRITSAAASFK